MEHFVRPRQRVLLKPNMLSAVPLEQRVPTDPAVVRAVGKLVLKAGGGITICPDDQPLPHFAEDQWQQPFQKHAEVWCYL